MTLQKVVCCNVKKIYSTLQPLCLWSIFLLSTSQTVSHKVVVGDTKRTHTFEYSQKQRGKKKKNGHVVLKCLCLRRSSLKTMPPPRRARESSAAEEHSLAGAFVMKPGCQIIGNPLTDVTYHGELCPTFMFHSTATEVTTTHCKGDCIRMPQYESNLQSLAQHLLQRES